MDDNASQDFLRDLAEKFAEINELFGDYDITPPSVDCDEEECEFPDDESVVTLHKLLREANLLLEDYIN